MSEELIESNLEGWDTEVRGIPAKISKPTVNFASLRSVKSNEIEDLIDRCLAALQKAHEGKFDSDEAQNMAAVFLSAQLKLSYFISEVELHARQSKNEIARVEAEKYQELKTGKSTSGKLTEGALQSAIAACPSVIDAKSEWAKAESEIKKWNYILMTLKEGHIYFRNLGKGPTNY